MISTILSKFIRVARWPAIALALIGLAWLGWYGYAKGLGRHWRDLLEKEFARYGLNIDVGKITLDPFRGLIARDVQIFDNKEEVNLLAEINQVSLDINYANLFQHEPALNAVDLSGATLLVPLNFRSPKSERVRVTDFHARIYFFPGRIEVRQASGLLYGIRINAGATFVNPKSLAHTIAEVANDPDPPDATVRFISFLFDELRNLQYRETPNLSFSFQMDLANPRDWRISAGSFVAASLERHGEELKDFAAKFGFENHQFSIQSLHITDGRGELFAVGSWDVATGQKKFQLRSTLDLSRLLRDEPGLSWLREWAFPKAPEIELAGEVRRNWELNVIGKLSLDQFSVRGVSFQGLRAEFSKQGKSWMVSNVELTHRTGTLTGQVLNRPRQFRLELHSALNPKAIAPFLPAPISSLLSDWDFQAPPVLQLTLSGPRPELQQLEGIGQFWLGRTRFRGAYLDSGEGSFHLNQSKISFENVRVSREEGAATGSLTFDLLSKELDRLQAEAHLQPTVIADWLEPSLLPLIEHFRFSSAPDITIDSTQVQKKTDLHLQINAASPLVYYCGFLEIPLDSAAADFRQTADQITLSVPNGRIGTGQCSISAEISHPKSNSTIDSAVTFNRVSMLNLKNRVTILDGWQGELSGSLKIRFDSSDSTFDAVEGKLSLTGTDFSKPRFFEFGFRKLLAAGFGHSGDLGIQFVTNSGLVKISQLTLTSAGHFVELSGTLNLLAGALQLSGNFDSGTALTRVTGKITDPDWEFIEQHPE